MTFTQKTKNFFFIAFILQAKLFCAAFSTTTPNVNTQTSVSFIENKGQVHDQNYKPRPDVLFSGTDGNLVYHIKKNGISYQLTNVDAWKETENPGSKYEKKNTSDKQKIAVNSTIYRIDINWLNVNTNVILEKDDALPGVQNYYNEFCPNGITNVKSYKNIVLKNIYKGINIKWYESNSTLEYDFIVAPGADYRNIQLEIRGAKKLNINSFGELEIITPLGTIIEKAPIAIQNKKTILCSWQLKNNIVSFNLGNYDPKQPVVIDPAVRIWGTYYGGIGIEYGYGCSTDALGNAYICGFTQTTVSAIMATTGAHQTSSGGGTNDSFLAKFNANGTRLWATFYGGSGLDVGTACATDPSGNVIMSGYTDSNNGIASIGSHQTNTVGAVEAFLVKFNGAGVRQWGTYYADTLNDYGYGCAFDGAGNAFLCGYTTSTGTLISTPGSHQVAQGGGNQDAFLVKFNGAGVRQWGTYYGGSGNDLGFNCITDATGNVFLSGRTASTNSAAIATVGSHQPISGGNFDAFLVKFNAAGVRQWGTHYGGFGIDYGYSCATDAAGNVFLSGSTDSNFSTEIATVGSQQSVFGGGPADAYLVKFNSTGVRQWGTYYGGNNYEEGVTCVTDIFGNVYMCGQTSTATSTVMATSGSHQSVYGGGAYDAYLVKFSTNGARQFGTYYGETGSDYGFACSVDPNFNIFMVGYTNTLGGTSIATIGSHQPTMGGGTFDAFLAKFFDCPIILTDAINQVNVSCNGYSDGAITATVLSAGSGFTYSWQPVSSSSPSISALAAGFYTCVITNTCGSTSSQTVQITQPPGISLTATSNNPLLCIGDACTLSAFGSGGSGSFSYTWNPGPVSNSIIVSPTVNTTYSIIATDVNGCSTSTTLTQNVTICTSLTFQNSEANSFLKIFPNPNNGTFLITASENVTLVITGVLGQKIKTISLNELNNYQFKISNFDNGIYFIYGYLNNNWINQKVIVGN